MLKSGAGLALIAALLCIALSLAGIMAMTGALRTLTSPALSADVHLAEFPLPKGFGLDPQEVADFLVDDLTERAETDIALRLAMGSQGQLRLIEVGIPRLVSSVVVRDMIREIKPLADVLSVGAFKVAARVVVRNLAQDRKDVVLTMPDAILAEAETGSVAIETTSTGLTALTLGDMAAGEERVLRVWLGAAAVAAGPGFDKSVLLGDRAGQSGQVWIYGTEAWHGADLQAMPIARWMVGGVLLAVFVSAALSAIFVLMTAMRRRLVSPV